MIVSLALFTKLAAQCAPTVHVETLAAVAHTESGFHAGAIHDNTTGRSYWPNTREDAVALATDLVQAQRHSVDLGLMQVNSAHLIDLRMTVAQAFDPCRNLKAGAQLLNAGYQPSRALLEAGQDSQPALLQAISRYNTGHPQRGFSNGYVARVVASAEQIVPAIRIHEQRATTAMAVVSPQDDTAALASSASLSLSSSASQLTTPETPPTWDVFGRARYTRHHGPASSQAPIMPLTPIMLKAEPLQNKRIEPTQPITPPLNREARDGY